MLSSASRSVPWLLAAVLWFVPAQTRASGGVEVLPLKHAIEQASAVFVVERADPFQYDVRLLRQPPKRRGCDTNTPHLTYLSLTIREVVYLRSTDTLVSGLQVETKPPAKRCWLKPSTIPKQYRVELPAQPSELLWLIDSGDVQNINVTWTCIESGSRKIPIYERLEGGLRQEAIVAGKQYLLLARHAADYQSYEGVGGWGLLDLSKRDAIERLLQDNGHDAPLLPAATTQSGSVREPSPTEDGEILEAVFRYQMARVNSEGRNEATSFCLQLADEQDLPADFLRRFGKKSKIRNATGCTVITRDGGAFVLDRSSRLPAMKLGIQSIRRVSTAIAIVVVGDMQDGSGPRLYDYVLGRQGSRWVVMRDSGAKTLSVSGQQKSPD